MTGRTARSLRAVAALAAGVGSWAAAAEGRRRTEHALDILDRAQWRVWDRVALPGGGHVDHVIVGPSGVYVLASTSWHGVVTVDQKGATITPTGTPDTAWTARGQHRSLPPAAVAVVRSLNAANGTSFTAPRPVVVIWAPFPERIAVSGGVTYVAGEDLAGWLAGQPGVDAGAVRTMGSPLLRSRPAALAR